MSTLVRPELPPIPARMAKLPVARGYPVPWFVEWIDGVPDFRIMDGRKLVRAVREKLCWVCGQRLGSFLAFTIGPMCAVNRISAEPPSHRECAVFSAKACPFLTRPTMHRRTAGFPEEAEKPGGLMLDRNPGVALVWITKMYRTIPQENGRSSPLFRMGEARDVFAFSHGGDASRTEIHDSIASGLPALVGAAMQDGPDAIKELAHALRVACALLRIPAIPLPQQELAQ
jgi:hypothetical protein